MEIKNIIKNDDCLRIYLNKDLKNQFAKWCEDHHTTVNNRIKYLIIEHMNNENNN